MIDEKQLTANVITRCNNLYLLQLRLVVDQWETIYFDSATMTYEQLTNMVRLLVKIRDTIDLNPDHRIDATIAGFSLNEIEPGQLQLFDQRQNCLHHYDRRNLLLLLIASLEYHIMMQSAHNEANSDDSDSDFATENFGLRNGLTTE